MPRNYIRRNKNNKVELNFGLTHGFLAYYRIKTWWLALWIWILIYIEVHKLSCIQDFNIFFSSIRFKISRFKHFILCNLRCHPLCCLLANKQPSNVLENASSKKASKIMPNFCLWRINAEKIKNLKLYFCV